MMGIPTWATDLLLPVPTLNVVDLIKHPLPSMENQLILNPYDPSFFSSIPTSIKDARSARLLLSLPVPTLASLKMTQDHVETAEIQGSTSFLLPEVGLRMPFWVLEIWEALYAVDRSRRNWVAAIKFLEGQPDMNVSSVLQAIPWDTRLPPYMGSEVDLLGWYCSTQWLSDMHMDQMGTLLRIRLVSEDVKTVSILSVFDVNNLIRAHRYTKETYLTSQSMHHLRDVGDRLSTQAITSVVAYVCVGLNEVGEYSLPSMCGDDTGNHWVSLVVDVCGGYIWVGDSKGHRAPEELVVVLVWWLKNHGISEAIDEIAMECTIQTDSFSCSVLCHNALEHHFFPSDVSLVQAKDALSERVHILSRIVIYLKSVVSSRYNHVKSM